MEKDFILGFTNSLKSCLLKQAEGMPAEMKYGLGGLAAGTGIGVLGKYLYDNYNAPKPKPQEEPEISQYMPNMYGDMGAYGYMDPEVAAYYGLI